MPRPTARRRPAEEASVLGDLDVAFANPGGLRMRCFVPAGLAASAPLVVVLHGCTQTAAGYDRGSGWSTLAARHGFALLYPEQGRANNANGCFNWFEPGDVQRGSGEAASIAGAVAAMVAAHRLDPARVFVTGLSAGGAMANVLLATYPDVFAGGAVIAGLPFGAAHGVGEALAVMRNPGMAMPQTLGDRVRAASSFAGPWPIVQVWHGNADRTVEPGNGRAVAAQWANVRGVSLGADGVGRTASGVPVVELVTVPGMGHGTPIDGRDGSSAAPFMLDVGVGSTARIAAFWGLAAPVSHRAAPRPRAGPAPGAIPRPIDLGRLIGDTLRSVGLMK